MKIKKPPVLGESAWEVEWCYELPTVEGCNDADIDRAKFSRSMVKSKEAAMELAKKVYPLDKFGAVKITPMEYRDDIGEGIAALFDWAAAGDSIEYSGD